MKKTTTILSLCLLLLACNSLNAQVLLAKWTFPTGTAGDSLADGGLAANLTMAIHTEGGTSPIDFSKNGFTTKSAQATGWDNGSMTKCWVVPVNTLGYKELKLSSKQQSGGNNPGPRDYMVQYRVGTAAAWTDVPNTAMVTANNWTSAALDSIVLPDSCANRPMVYLRWVMTSDTNSSGSPVTSAGINKIDDIYITGKQISTGVNNPENSVVFSVFPNPSNGPVTVTSQVILRSIDIIDLGGRIVYSDQAVNSRAVNFLPGIATKGCYFIRVLTRAGQTSIKQVILY